MMVLRQNAANAASDPSPQGTIYPADRCTWQQRYLNDQYDIETAIFYPGHAAPIALGDNVTLGFIGKSGRFVPITDG